MKTSLATELKSQTADFQVNLKHQILAWHTKTDDKINKVKIDVTDAKVLDLTKGISATIY